MRAFSFGNMCIFCECAKTYITLYIFRIDRRQITDEFHRNLRVRRTPRIILDGRSTLDRRSPTPSFGGRKNHQPENKKFYGDHGARKDDQKDHYCHWYRPRYWPEMITVGRQQVHAHCWWELVRSKSYGSYYFRNTYGDTLWPAK